MTEADVALLGFARALRSAGVPVTADRAASFLTAAALVGVDRPMPTYWAGRATLCGAPDDLAVYDTVFHAWFFDDGSTTTGRRPPAAPPLQQAWFGEDEGSGDGLPGAEETMLHVAASDQEILRHRDIATMSQAEKARLADLFAHLRPIAPRRTSFRRVPAARGRLDAQVTLRRTLERMGEPVELAWRHRSTRPRRVVVLLDVSGSMSAYADALLRFAHCLTRLPGAEAFSVGTRVTRLTRPLRLRDADRAIVAAGEAVPDWSGGTRLGEGLEVFLDRWGQRGLARGAVVVVFSDGWERGDATLLGEQMQRLQRLAHKVVWVNPHKGLAGYQPVQQGMAAALPHVDAFVAGHSLAAFEEVVEVVGHA